MMKMMDERMKKLEQDASTKTQAVHVKKAECRRIDAFELWCWSRLLRVPWTARSSNQSILKEISPEYSLEEYSLDVEVETPILSPCDVTN